MAMVEFEEDAFLSMTNKQRDDIRSVLRIVSGKALDAYALIPGTWNGTKAKTALVEANEWLMDLHTALKKDGWAR